MKVTTRAVRQGFALQVMRLFDSRAWRSLGDEVPRIGRLVEFWRWTYRDPDTGLKRYTTHRMTAREAKASYVGARPVPGTLEFREVDFQDTTPNVRLS